MLCLFILCLAPYLIDVATCEEFSPSPLHQPALIDGEEVDPFEAAAVPVSHDDQTHSLNPLSGLWDDQKPVGNFARLSPSRNFAIVSLTPRPPPVS